MGKLIFLKDVKSTFGDRYRAAREARRRGRPTPPISLARFRAVRAGTRMALDRPASDVLGET